MCLVSVLHLKSHKLLASLGGNGTGLHNDPLKAKPRWRERATPLAFHGDGAQLMHKSQQSVFCELEAPRMPKTVRARSASDGVDSAMELWEVVFFVNFMSDGVRLQHEHSGSPWDKNTRRARLAGNPFCSGQ